MGGDLQCICGEEGMRATCSQDDSSLGPMLLLLLGVVWYAWCQCVGESDADSDDAPSEMYS
eukprot:COSAG02_NODE_4527_length_5256_cov_7.579794_2_plen_61_part_00